MTGGSALGRISRRISVRVAQALDAAGLHEFARAQRQELGARQPRHRRPGDDADGDGDRLERRLPNTATSTSSSRKFGTVWKASVRRISASSIAAAVEARHRADGDADDHRRSRWRRSRSAARCARRGTMLRRDVAPRAVGAEREARIGAGPLQRPAGQAERIIRDRTRTRRAAMTSSTSRMAEPISAAGLRA